MRLALLADLPGRDEAREAAERELSRRAYREAEPGWLSRLLSWVVDQLDELLSKASGSLPGGRWGLAVLLALVAVLVAVVITRLRPGRTAAGLGLLFTGGVELNAQQHRDLAEAAAARGDLAEAVRERLRAVVRDLEERGLVDRRPGRTADEVAREAGAVLPTLAGRLADGARVFDEIWYGGRPADRSDYAVLVELDRDVAAARLVTT